MSGKSLWHWTCRSVTMSGKLHLFWREGHKHEDRLLASPVKTLSQDCQRSSQLMSYVGDNNHYDHDDDDGDCRTKLWWDWKIEMVEEVRPEILSAPVPFWGKCTNGEDSFWQCVEYKILTCKYDDHMITILIKTLCWRYSTYFFFCPPCFMSLAYFGWW